MEDLNKKAEKYTAKILGYKKQELTSNEWDWIQNAFIAGYNRKLKDDKERNRIVNSKYMIDLAKDRMDTVVNKGWEWKSYYNGFIDGFAKCFTNHILKNEKTK